MHRLRWLPLLALCACATFTAARPLEPGETLVGATVGGAMLTFGGPLPLPNVVLEGRHGLPHLAERPFDVGYGLNATGLAFGLLQGHVGASWLLVPQSGARPAVSLGNRVFFAFNVPGPPGRVDPELEGWGADQLEVTGSWEVGHALPYLSFSQYTDFGNPELLLTPAAGVQLDPSEPGGFLLQTELRWYAFHRSSIQSIPPWIPGDAGVLGVSVSAGTRFGGGR
jgi:hypothetical protein